MLELTATTKHSAIDLSVLQIYMHMRAEYNAGAKKRVVYPQLITIIQRGQLTVVGSFS